MIDDLTALVKATLLANPADAAPRLILADIVEELGHAENAADLRRPVVGSGCVAMMDMVFGRRLFPRGKASPHADVPVGIREVLSAIDSARAMRLAAAWLRERPDRLVGFGFLPSPRPRRHP